MRTSTNWIRKHQWLISLFIITIFVYGWVFRSLIFNLETHLFDWNDYPLYVWIINQNISHFQSLNWSEIFQGNIFYPFKDVLLFSDLFIPQSLIGLILKPFFSNPIASFNLIFLTTILLNSLTSYYFWSAFFDDKRHVWLASISTIFSSYLFQNWSHFQIFSLWPFLLTSGWFFRKKVDWQRGVVGGLLISLLFYSSIYLWVMFLTIMSLYYLFNWVQQKIPFRKGLIYLGISFSVFILLSGITAFRYWQVRQNYQAQRNYGEYVQYSSHLSDYLFPVHNQSLIYGLKPFKTWQGFNQHYGSFPGIVVTALFLLGVISVSMNYDELSLRFDLRFQNIFFFTLLIIGFIFSLGPRLNVNGLYTGLPLPYHFLVRLPLLEVFRVPARWSLLLVLAMIYFAIKALEKYRFPSWLIISIGLLVVVEATPISKPTQTKNYYPTVYEEIANKCQEKLVLLEYPLTQDKEGANIITNLSYRTQMMLASLKHGCYLVNGYTGYIPREYEIYEAELGQRVIEGDKSNFTLLLQQKGVDLIKLNKTELFNEKAELIEGWLTTENEFELIYQNQQYLIVEIKNV